MHVGLNLLYLVPGETGGMETYARELIGALARVDDVRLTAFINEEARRSEAAAWLHEMRSVVVPIRARRRTQWVRGEQALLPRLARREGIDVLHSLASTAPVWGGFRRVVTIHDLIYLHHPEAHFGVLSRGMQILVPLAARRCDRVIAVSASTREDLVERLGISSSKVDVVPHGIGMGKIAGGLSADEIRNRFDLGRRRVVLTVSAKRRHKNLGRLITALAAIPQERRPLLVLPGYPTPHEQELRRQASELGVQDDVRFVAWVEPEELEGLYDVADGLVFPSLYEGFGLPVLEAMARGVPVACSATPSLDEVAGDAALRFDPMDADDIARATEALLAGGPDIERRRQAGLAHASAFTWERAARETARTYARALDTSSPAVAL